jgi:hypothetical protein
MDWPTEDLDASNAALRPSTLTGGYAKKRKEPTPLGLKTTQSNQRPALLPSNDLSDSGEDGDGEDISHIAKKLRTVESSAKQRTANLKVVQKLTKTVVKERKVLDPRFLEHTGTYDRSKHAKNYEFLNELREDEIRILRRDGKRVKDGTKKEEIRRAIQSREEKIRHHDRDVRQEKLFTEYKVRQKELAKQGVTTGFMSEGKLKKQLGAAQEFLNLSDAKIDRRIKRHQEKHINRDKANFHKQLGNSGSK